MTLSQLGLLAGLAGAACLLFGLAGWFVLRGKSGLLARAPENTPVPRATSTLIVIPTLTPTQTPTPVPYEMLIPSGWEQFKTGLVEIWLPSSFKPGDAKLLRDWTKLAAPDLIMMGSRGVMGINALLLGSEAVKVLTHAKIPVLVVR